jgi:hypothetical protein
MLASHVQQPSSVLDYAFLLFGTRSESQMENECARHYPFVPPSERMRGVRRVNVGKVKIRREVPLSVLTEPINARRRRRYTIAALNVAGSKF